MEGSNISTTSDLPSKASHNEVTAPTDTPPCKDGLLPSATSKTLEVGKYLALRSLAIKEVDIVIICQHCLTNKEQLKAEMSQKPSPPCAFGRHNFSHLS